MKVQAGRIGADGELKVTVSGEFDFETARELLFLCKARWVEGARTILIDMQGVNGISSSGVGTLVLLSELAGNQHFHIQLHNCSEGIRALFASGLLDKYFPKETIFCCEPSVEARPVAPAIAAATPAGFSAVRLTG